jgi:hypothetical protein
MPESIQENGGNPVQDNQEKIDFTKYPEGFEAALRYLDFLPDDLAVRRRFLMNLMETLARR